ncbi:hypothetical protein CcrC1_gp182 [Caulobacter phage C1]|nr:hypothetical protein CcrC1_gp182 [Caulobacter phage C1]UTU08411.1 hypothetical protein CcrC2_gp183 [Caulobacter phage C2]UTU08928.1 hypothetical protein CcrJ4_gp177 [Caulobacter phage J4]UTU09484.1 hypothetical protein CcrBL47_gp198 [Caulobacter phage BL47]UTU10044.1 hypothetical protein CcrRB23_gp182 [Caulobacter phage RB23]WGN97079.1 hypothetical protein [Bertelyvirus sp.]
MATLQWLDAFFAPRELTLGDKIAIALNATWAAFIIAATVLVWIVGAYSLGSWLINGGGA